MDKIKQILKEEFYDMQDEIETNMGDFEACEDSYDKCRKTIEARIELHLQLVKEIYQKYADLKDKTPIQRILT